MESPGWGKRHVVAMLGFVGFFNVYAMRVNLSVAAIPMADDHHWCGANVTAGTECGTTGTVLGSVAPCTPVCKQATSGTNVCEHLLLHSLFTRYSRVQHLEAVMCVTWNASCVLQS